jgi:uncharacterized protein with PIN domain
VIWTVLGTIGIALATVVLGMLADRKWHVIPRKETLIEAGKPTRLLAGYAPGDAAATAIASSPGEIEKLRRKQRCPKCSTEMNAIADDRVSYEEHELVVLRFSCPKCKAARSIYVRPATR